MGGRVGAGHVGKMRGMPGTRMLTLRRERGGGGRGPSSSACARGLLRVGVKCPGGVRSEVVQRCPYNTRQPGLFTASISLHRCGSPLGALGPQLDPDGPAGPASGGLFPPA